MCIINIDQAVHIVKHWSQSILGYKKNTAGRGGWTDPTVWPMSERAKPCGEHSEGIFLPTSENLSHLGFKLATSWVRRYWAGLTTWAARPFAVLLGMEDVNFFFCLKETVPQSQNCASRVTCLAPYMVWHVVYCCMSVCWHLCLYMRERERLLALDIETFLWRT